eukprot:271824_1
MELDPKYYRDERKRNRKVHTYVPNAPPNSNLFLGNSQSSELPTKRQRTSNSSHDFVPSSVRVPPSILLQRVSAGSEIRVPINDRIVGCSKAGTFDRLSNQQSQLYLAELDGISKLAAQRISSIMPSLEKLSTYVNGIPFDHQKFSQRGIQRLSSQTSTSSNSKPVASPLRKYKAKSKSTSSPKLPRRPVPSPRRRSSASKLSTPQRKRAHAKIARARLAKHSSDSDYEASVSSLGIASSPARPRSHENSQSKPRGRRPKQSGISPTKKERTPAQRFWDNIGEYMRFPEKADLERLSSSSNTTGDLQSPEIDDSGTYFAERWIRHTRKPTKSERERITATPFHAPPYEPRDETPALSAHCFTRRLLQALIESDGKSNPHPSGLDEVKLPKRNLPPESSHAPVMPKDPPEHTQSEIAEPTQSEQTLSEPTQSGPTQSESSQSKSTQSKHIQSKHTQSELEQSLEELKAFSKQYSFEERVIMELGDLGIIDVEIDKHGNLIYDDLPQGPKRTDDEVCIFMRDVFSQLKAREHYSRQLKSALREKCEFLVEKEEQMKRLTSAQDEFLASFSSIMKQKSP